MFTSGLCSWCLKSVLEQMGNTLSGVRVHFRKYVKHSQRLLLLGLLSALEQKKTKWRLLLCSYISTLWSSAYTHLYIWSSSTYVCTAVLCTAHSHTASLVLGKRRVSGEMQQAPCLPWQAVQTTSINKLFLVRDIFCCCFLSDRLLLAREKNTFWRELW